MAVEAIEVSNRVNRLIEELFCRATPVKDESELQYFSANDTDVIAMVLSDIRERLGISSPDQPTHVIEFIRGNDKDAIERNKAIKQIAATNHNLAPNDVLVITQREGSLVENVFKYTPHESGAIFTGGWSIENEEPPKAQSAEPLQAAA